MGNVGRGIVGFVPTATGRAGAKGRKGTARTSTRWNRAVPGASVLLAAALTIMWGAPARCVTLQPGWPKSTGGIVWSAPALADLDGDGQLEVVVGSYDHQVYAWHADGTSLVGWPQDAGTAIGGGPALADLDGDGDLEVVTGTEGGQVYAWHGNGTPVSGWPQTIFGGVHGSPALGDLDGDGDLEVVVGAGAKVYAWHSNGAPLAGWPKTTGNGVESSPALGDLDGDGDLEVVVGSDDSNVYAWHGDGTAVAGWPQTTGAEVWSSPALGDIDGDGRLEVLAGCLDGKIYAWHGDGTPVSGWPQATTGGFWFASVALGDLDGDGRLEVVIGSYDFMVYAWHGNGTPVAGWPRDVAGPVDSSPALGDLDGDGCLEVVVGTGYGTACALHGNGAPVAGWPQTTATGGTLGAGPALGDLDGDGDTEVVLGSYDHSVYVWSCDTPTSDTLAWPTFHHDMLRTGRYGPITPGVPALSSGYVSPSSGDTSTQFTWRVKYWQTANVLASRVQVGIWSSATKSTSWRQMWAYDPSDTNCVDGKWYTYSATLPAGSCAYRFAAQVGDQWIYWPQPTGTYNSGPTVAQGNPVTLTAGYVTPASGTNATNFTWRVKYWNTLNAAPDEIKVAIWFPTLKTTYWYSMYPLDPSDTRYSDGAVYQYSRKWLPAGSYAYRFAARQGSWWAYWPSPAGTYASGPSVSGP